MNRWLIVMFVLLVGALLTSSVALAASPDPVKVNASVHPSTAQVGDSVTLSCKVSPSQGAVVQFVGFGFEAGYSDETFIRGFGDHGPVIWQVPLNTSTPGTYEGFCSGRVIRDGAPFDAIEYVTVEILP